jgi:type II secretory pathway pseudopilin PulG
MRTFFGTPLADPRRRRRGSPALDPGPRLRLRLPFRGRAPRGEEGFLLVEVMISALLAALIVAATFNGLDVTNRLTADQRRHSEAVLLAAQSQEQLRSDSATVLDVLETSPHIYAKEVNKTTFKITQEAKPLNANGQLASCDADEKTGTIGANIEIVSSVTWSALSKAGRPAVKATAIITPPVGSALEVDVTGGGSPPAEISGVTAIAKYLPVESGVYNTVEGTTGEKGCVVLTGLAATSATLEIAQKLNYVTVGGLLKWGPKEVTIAPNITTHEEVRYAEGGRLKAKFTYKGATTFEGKTVTGDTFTVFNSGMKESPEFEVGSTAFKYEGGGEEHYTPVTGTYAAEASTPTGAKYSTGDLFPLEGWSASAGDCHANATASTEAPSANATVVSGESKTVEVPTSYVNLTVYSGTQSSHGSVESTIYPVLIADTACEGSPTPNNAAATDFNHAQTTSATGHLEAPFQPFGKASLCVYNGTAKKTYRVSYTNSKAEGSSPNVYIGELSEAEKVAKRKAEEEAAKKARETTEAEAKKARETSEEAERTKWKKEETEKIINKAKREELEKKQGETRKTKETEEANTKKTKEKEEKELREKREKEEAEEAAKKEVTVASGQASC